ncbi:MAG: lysozyme [Capsulimonadaceae bacterium]|nr:lysozyme [Capsulimonadaceae bacterium]
MSNDDVPLDEDAKSGEANPGATTSAPGNGTTAAVTQHSQPEQSAGSPPGPAETAPTTADLTSSSRTSAEGTAALDDGTVVSGSGDPLARTVAGGGATKLTSPQEQDFGSSDLNIQVEEIPPASALNPGSDAMLPFDKDTNLEAPDIHKISAPDAKDHGKTDHPEHGQMRPINENTLHMVEAFEGWKENAYRDIGGVLTIGYGHTRGVQEGQHMTRREGKDILQDDLESARRDVVRLIHVPLTDNQYGALVSLVFNAGSRHVAPDSPIGKHLAAGEYDKASNDFLLINKYHKHDNNGKPVGLPIESKGLTNRRKKERELFLKPD